jgi:hypothetical protein
MNDLVDFTPFGLAFKTRNQFIDSGFYDVGALTFSEWVSLNPLTDVKGKILVVPPSAARREKIRHFRNAEEFLVSDAWKNIVAIAVAGVGSSVIGTAALARNVADACHGDVAAVVSGYGLSDVVLEGIGGWYFYGMLDQWRYELSSSLDDWSALLAQCFARGPDIKKTLSEYFDFPLDDYIPPFLDAAALYSMLLRRYFEPSSTNLRLLVGHSKGNLLIGDILNHFSHVLEDVNGDTAFQNLAVVTLGAVVDLPKNVILAQNQYQFLGTLDALGRFNSRYSIAGDVTPTQWIHGAWHTLNTRLLGHMDVIDILTNRVKFPASQPLTATERTEGVGSERRKRLTAAFDAMAASRGPGLSAFVDSK